MLDKTKSIADPESDLKEAFRVFDLDGDGIITVSYILLVRALSGCRSFSNVTIFCFPRQRS